MKELSNINAVNTTSVHIPNAVEYRPVLFEGKGHDDLCCGCCQFMSNEDIDGYGLCKKFNIEIHCSDVCLSCNPKISKQK